MLHFHPEKQSQQVKSAQNSQGHLPRLINMDQRLADLCKQSLVLTPNNRLAEALKQAFVHFQVDSGQQAWQTPNICAYSQHLQQQYSILLARTEASAHLLDNAQQHLAWLACVPDLPTENDPPHWPGLAKLAAESWRTIHEWQIKLESSQFSLNDSSALFQSWAQAFERNLERNHWITSSEIPQALAVTVCENAQQKKENYSALRLAPQNIVLFGFENESRAQCLLFNAYQSSGSTLHREKNSPQHAASTVRVVVFESAEEELTHVAQWARKQVESRTDKHSIGIIVPGLEVQHAKILRHFDNAFSPGTAEAAPMQRSFNLSGGISLGRTTVCSDALRLLGWISKAQSPHSILQISRSPYLRMDGLEDASRLRDTPISMQYFNRKASLEVLTDILATGHLQGPGKHPLAAWASTFEAILGIAQWPQKDSLESIHYQAAEQFSQHLESLKNSIQIIEDCSFSQALAYFTAIIAQVKFSPQSSQVPIQIMTALEADGLSFDQVWLLGFNNRDWPANPAVTPFIPFSLLLEHSVPRISMQSELEFAQRFLNNLQQLSEKVCVSYARFNGDEVLEMSKLISTYQEPEFILPEQSRFHALAEQSSTHIETYNDYEAPKIDVKNRVRGGSGLLTDQSNCPFRAFATHRLFAGSIRIDAAFPDASERGSILHNILEAFFKQVPGQAELQSLATAERDSLLHSIVQSAVAQKFRAYPERFKSRELARLIALVEEWLEVELQRPAFEVLSTEQELDCTVGDFNIKVRVDRIDLDIDSGSKIIIDYKTAKVSIQAWGGERLTEPQLPLYALQSADTSTLLYAQVRSQEGKYTGLSDVYESSNKNKFQIGKHSDLKADSWATLNKNWQQAIATVAGEFQNGYAEVKPLRTTSCNYCEYHSLCRISESAARKVQQAETPAK